MPTIREVEESKEVLAPLSPPAHAPSLMSDIGSDEEDNSERWNQRPMPLWIELRATENPGFRVYLNTETNELSAVNPDALDDPDADATLARAWNPRQSRAIDESDEAAVKARAAHRCRECVDSMARQADLCLAQAPHVSPEMADAAAALKQAVVAARSALVTTSLKGVEAEEATVVDFLVGWKQLRWDFANNSAVDYFRASAARTDLQSVGFSQWHFPEYFSDQPLIGSCVKANCVVRLPANDRIQQTTVVVAVDELVGAVIRRAYSKLPRTSPNLGVEADYVLKVTGQNEFLAEDRPFFAYACVRKSLRDQADVELTLVRRPEPILTQEMNDKVAARLAAYHKKVNPDVPVLEKHTFGDLGSLTAIDYADVRCLTHLPMSGLNVPFRARVLGIENVNCDTFPRLTADISAVGLRACLFHGTQKLAWDHELPMLDVADTVHYHADLVGGYSSLVSMLPREVRVGFVVVGRKGEDKEVPLGWVCSQLVSPRGYMETGRVQYRLWAFPAKEGKKHGKKRDVDPNFLFRAATVDNGTVGIAKAVLHVQYPEYCLPVVAPLAAPYVDANTRLMGTELRRPLDKAQSQALAAVLCSDPLFDLNEDTRQLLWNCRHYLTDVPALLPKLLQCVCWGHQDARNEAHRMLRLWARPAQPIEALELLDARYPDYTVREYAVEVLRLLPDDDLQLYLLQMVQCLKFEPYHDSPLSRFLVERAVQNPYQIGHALYWHLKAELHDPMVCERFSVILELMLSHVGIFADELQKQVCVVKHMQKVAELIVQLKRELQYTNEEAMKEYTKELEKLNKTVFEPMGKFQLPLNPKIEATSLIVEKCRFMSSKMVPLWLVFKNADEHGGPIYVIFKSGDDLRQDLLTLQLLRVMDRLWLQQGLDMRLKPYSVIATGVNDEGEGVGMIEVVMNSATTSDIQREYGGGAMGALKLSPIDLFIREHNKDGKAHIRAVDNFVRSCAGYCVATFVLGIGDRHNGNIMVTKSGHLFHIDFGHFLGNFKKKFGVNRERAAFVFTPEMAYVMGGKDYKKHTLFNDFKKLCSKSFKVLRVNAGLLENLFILMVAAGMPELMKETDICYLREKLHLDKDSKQANKELHDELKKSLDSTYRRIDNYIHNIRHG
jgi:phosphatidylinositol-4,5-bisphosphate 3-kinase